MRQFHRSAFLTILLLAILVYVLHIPILLLSRRTIPSVITKISSTPSKQSLTRQHSATQVVQHRDVDFTQQVVYLSKRKIEPNITNILVRKKMGKLLNEMSAYKRLIRKEIENKDKVQNGKQKPVVINFKAETVEELWAMYRGNVTNFFDTLTLDIVTPFNARYLINNETLCLAGQHQLTYLVYVHSAPGNVLRRNAMRMTWAQPDLFPQFPSRIVFFVGRPTEHDKKKQALLEVESHIHGDIVQLDFVDAYHNLSYKAIGAMRWIAEFCPNTQYVFKTDDDVYVNMLGMMQRLTKEFKSRAHFIMGMIWTFPSLHIERPGRICSKWCIPFKVLPGLVHFPTYASGSFYIMTQDVAAELYDSALRTPFFWVDDAHITGIVASRVPDLEHIDISKAYRFNIKIYKERLESSNPFIVTLSSDLIAMWKFHLPLMPKQGLDLLGQDRHKELMDLARHLS